MNRERTPKNGKFSTFLQFEITKFIETIQSIEPKQKNRTTIERTTEHKISLNQISIIRNRIVAKTSYF